MPRLKYFNNDTQEWEYVIVGGQGPQGEQGVQGEPGVISATDPIIYNAETQNVSLGSPDYITFDTTPETSSTTPGTIFWDNGEGTPTVVLNSNVNLNLGQENVALCYNGTGSTITNGSVVYISGAQGQRPSITLSDADTEATSSKTFGMVTEDIADGAEGFVTTFGIVNGINTSTFTEGQALWLSQTAGQVTATRPLAPAHTVFIGYCLKSNATSGRIFVNPQNGYELNELHDVLIEETVADNELIARDAASGLWKNQTAAEAGLSEIGHTHDDRYYTEAETDTAIANAVAGLVDAAPATLDTLNELAAAINDDANFASTVTTALAGKANTSHTHDDRYYTETETDGLLNSKLSLSGGVMTGYITGKVNTGGGLTSSNGTGSFEATGSSTQAAAISFHRPGIQAINMGLDTDNVFKIGGWSWSDRKWSVDGAGNTIQPGNITLDGSIIHNYWRTDFNRAWDNYPSITIYNTTDKGPQGEFRIHGYPGSNGGDYSVATRCDGGFITGSDARRKTNIEEISDALQRINAISGKTFNIINSEGNIETDLSSETTGKKFGFIAQEVADIIPEAVKYYPEVDQPNENGYASAYSIDYGSIVPLLLQGINELTQKVQELESRLNGGA